MNVLQNNKRKCSSFIPIGKECPLLFFETIKERERWLQKKPPQSLGRLSIYKKNS